LYAPSAKFGRTFNGRGEVAARFHLALSASLKHTLSALV